MATTKLTDAQRVGGPLGDPLCDLRKAGVAFGLDRALRRGTAQQPVAGGHAGALEAEVQCEKGLKMSGNGTRFSGHHAEPPG